MGKERFESVTYISAAPKVVWKALLDPQITRKYWQHVNLSDWKPGSKWEHRDAGARKTLRLVGRVVECAPPRRLVFTWAFPADESRAAGHSRVTFALKAHKKTTRLTVTHDKLEKGSAMLEGITEGWPMVLSSLKTLLETGKPLPKLW